VPTPEPLSTGADVRVTGPRGGFGVVCVNGGQRRDVPGTWSASLEWLVGRLASRFPELAFAEVRYRVKSWNRLGMCIEDALAALEHLVEAGSRRCCLLGFSMGGAVAVGAAAHPAVTTVVGLAPWFPERLSLDTLDGRRLAVVHGQLDSYLPGIPGVAPSNSRRGFERALQRGVDGTYTLLEGAIHGLAVRAPWGTPIPLPRARRWVELVADELDRFQADASEA
jgi:dienelactone hydrolase